MKKLITVSAIIAVVTLPFAIAQTTVAVSFVCSGNHSATVSQYVGLMDKMQLTEAIGLMRAPGCAPASANAPAFTRGNSVVVRQGQSFVAIQRKGESIYAVTTVGSWNSK